MITQEKLKEWIKYDKDTGIFYKAKVSKMDFKNKVGDIVANNLRSGYLRINIEGKVYTAHRLAWLYVYGEHPKLTIDHINRNKLDNRISNLRDVCASTQKINQGKNIRNKSGIVGVHYITRDKKWVATITPRGMKRIVLGRFDTRLEAGLARKEGEEKYLIYG